MKGKKNICIIVSTIMIFFLIGVFCGVEIGYRYGVKIGYLHALSDIQNLLAQKDITFDWKDYGNGSYEISVYLRSQLYAKGIAKVDLFLKHYRNGILLSSEHGSGVLTDIGKSFLEQQVSGSVNASEQALYCADSNDATDPALASWTELPSEITSNGLERQTGAYVHTGAANSGTWNVTKTKTATGTQSSQLWGLHWKTYADSSDNCLLCADTTPLQKNLVAGDTLAETWQLQVS